MTEITIRLPDGNFKKVEKGSNSLDLAKLISKSLAERVIVAKVNGKVTDIRDPLNDGDDVVLLDSSSIEANDILNHSAEHILAAAVMKIFPYAQVSMGPKDHESGFYYDFDVGRPLQEDDLAKIEEIMAELIKEKISFEKMWVKKTYAKELFKKLNQHYKEEILDWIEGDEVTLYKCDDLFTDLCRGPHLPHAGFIKAFKLKGIAGSYWRGDSTKKMLSRISGIAFKSKEELSSYLHHIEEAKKRDHRKIGQKLELFFHHEKIGPGLILWLPKGGLLRTIVEDFSKAKHLSSGYDMVSSPHIAKSDLWHTSGHLDFYKESMFAPMRIDENEYLLKPMNCPFHLLMYKFRPRSYKELPLRFAEFGTVYRYELAGVLHGLMRVRGFTQDDAHIFCRWDQLDSELDGVIKFMIDMLKAFGFSEFLVNISTRPQKFVGDVKLWEKAEESLKKSVERNGFLYDVDEGGGAFYGPKIDIKLKDCLGRLWQCSTVQLDFNNPERFDLHYVNSENQKERPVMLHRALFGSIERFIGILIEHYAGAFPAWLSPEQVRVLTVADSHNEFAKEVASRLCEEGIRAHFHEDREKLSAKIRDAQLEKIPFMVVIGNREVAENGGTLRLRSEEDKGFFPISSLIGYIKDQCQKPSA